MLSMSSSFHSILTSDLTRQQQRREVGLTNTNKKIKHECIWPLDICFESKNG